MLADRRVAIQTSARYEPCRPAGPSAPSVVSAVKASLSGMVSETTYARSTGRAHRARTAAPSAAAKASKRTRSRPTAPASRARRRARRRLSGSPSRCMNVQPSRSGCGMIASDVALAIGQAGDVARRSVRCRDALAARVAVDERDVAVAFEPIELVRGSAASRPSPCEAQAGITRARRQAAPGPGRAPAARRAARDTRTERNLPPAFGAKAAVGRRSGPVPGTSPLRAAICAPLQIPITNLPACAPAIDRVHHLVVRGNGPGAHAVLVREPARQDVGVERAAAPAEPRLQCTSSASSPTAQQRAQRSRLRCSSRGRRRPRPARSHASHRGRVEVAQRRRPRLVERIERELRARRTRSRNAASSWPSRSDGRRRCVTGEPRETPASSRDFDDEAAGLARYARRRRRDRRAAKASRRTPSRAPSRVANAILASATSSAAVGDVVRGQHEVVAKRGLQRARARARRGRSRSAAAGARRRPARRRTPNRRAARPARPTKYSARPGAA